MSKDADVKQTTSGGEHQDAPSAESATTPTMVSTATTVITVTNGEAPADVAPAAGTEAAPTPAALPVPEQVKPEAATTTIAGIELAADKGTQAAHLQQVDSEWHWIWLQV